MNICKSVEELQPPAKPATNPLDQVDAAERCVRRWAYKLGAAQGPNREIADAAVVACHEQIYLIPTAGSKEIKFPTDEQVDAETNSFSKDAINYVIEGRAGHCASLAEKMK